MNTLAPYVLTALIHRPKRWVATKMGGAHAPDDLAEAYRTQVWLAVSSNVAAEVTGKYFYHRKLREPNPAARDTTKQDKLIAACADFSGVKLPE